MRPKKLMVLPIIVIIALAGTGVAFSHWIDQLYVEGTVKGGTLALVFDELEPPICTEFHMNPDTGQLVLGEYFDKDNAFCEAYYVEYVQDVHSLKWGYKGLVIDIENAYPSYRAHTQFIFHNIGTIPIWICDIILSGAKMTKDDEFIAPLYFIRTNVPPGDIEGEIWEDLDYETLPGPSAGDKLVMNVVIQNGEFPFQLDPCDDDKGEIDFHFKQDVQQCHRYRLYFYLYGVQWNKECPEPGIIVVDNFNDF
jgi:hypothetical protein